LGRDFVLIELLGIKLTPKTRGPEEVSGAEPIRLARPDQTIRYLQKDGYSKYIKIDFYPIKYGIRYLIE
jgi:hypothetical protein